MITDIAVAHKLIATRDGAINRKLDFNLSFKELKRIMQCKKCYYTGEDLNHVEGSRNKLTLDRVDNTKGYVIGNVVPCSLQFNKLKANLTIEQVMMMHKAFKRKKLI